MPYVIKLPLCGVKRGDVLTLEHVHYVRKGNAIKTGKKYLAEYFLRGPKDTLSKRFIKEGIKVYRVEKTVKVRAEWLVLDDGMLVVLTKEEQLECLLMNSPT